jgi:hypothetical protein
MDKLEALQKAYKEVNRIKIGRGYQYGKSDCWTMFTMYDRNLFPDNNLFGKITSYSTHTVFHRKVRELGYTDVKEMVEAYGYKVIDFSNVSLGDVCFFDSKLVDLTVAIYTGKEWLNSSDDPSYEKLPMKYVKPRARILCRRDTDEKV